MATILMVFVGLLCLFLGVRVYNMEERAKVFNKRPIQVTDVKKYNHVCGAMIIFFGVVAEITIYFMVSTEGWISSLFTIGIIVEAVALTAVYNVVERRFIKQY